MTSTFVKAPFLPQSAVPEISACGRASAMRSRRMRTELQRADPAGPAKCRRECGCAREAHFCCHDLDGVVCFGQQLAGTLDRDLLHEGPDGPASLLPKCSDQLAGTHPAQGRKLPDRRLRAFIANTFLDELETPGRKATLVRTPIAEAMQQSGGFAEQGQPQPLQDDLGSNARLSCLATHANHEIDDGVALQMHAIAQHRFELFAEDGVIFELRWGVEQYGDAALPTIATLAAIAM